MFLKSQYFCSCRVPDPDTFTVYDVLELAGKERRIEVVEVNEQKGRTMKLSEFIKYYT